MYLKSLFQFYDSLFDITIVLGVKPFKYPYPIKTYYTPSEKAEQITVINYQFRTKQFPRDEFSCINYHTKGHTRYKDTNWKNWNLRNFKER